MFGSAFNMIDSLTDNTVHDIAAVVLATVASQYHTLSLVFFILSGMMVSFKIFKIALRVYRRRHSGVERDNI